jgi:hypothetical protein
MFSNDVQNIVIIYILYLVDDKQDKIKYKKSVLPLYILNNIRYYFLYFSLY